MKQFITCREAAREIQSLRVIAGGTGKLPVNGVWTVLAPLALKMRDPKVQSTLGFRQQGHVTCWAKALKAILFLGRLEQRWGSGGQSLLISHCYTAST